MKSLWFVDARGGPRWRIDTSHLAEGRRVSWGKRGLLRPTILPGDYASSFPCRSTQIAGSIEFCESMLLSVAVVRRVDGIGQQ